MINKPEQLTDERLSWFHDILTNSDAMGLDVTMPAEQLLRLTTELQERRKVDTDRLQESAYKVGLTAGWNFGIEHNSAGFSKCLSAHEYAAPQPAPVVPDNSTCKYCGGTGYFRWQQSANEFPCPCKGCTEPKKISGNDLS